MPPLAQSAPGAAGKTRISRTAGSNRSPQFFGAVTTTQRPPSSSRAGSHRSAHWCFSDSSALLVKRGSSILPFSGGLPNPLVCAPFLQRPKRVFLLLGRHLYSICLEIWLTSFLLVDISKLRLFLCPPWPLHFLLIPRILLPFRSNSMRKSPEGLRQILRHIPSLRPPLSILISRQFHRRRIPFTCIQNMIPSMILTFLMLRHGIR